MIHLYSFKITFIVVFKLYFESSEKAKFSKSHKHTIIVILGFGPNNCQSQQIEQMHTSCFCHIPQRYRDVQTITEIFTLRDGK